MLPTSERIYQAAIDLFAERGYANTSMRDISDAVGILPGSLYAHIKSKETVLLSIVETGIDRYLDAIRPHAVADAPPDERLAGAIHAYVLVLSEHLRETTISFHQWDRLTDEAHRQTIVKKRDEYDQLFTRIIRDGVSSGVFRPLDDARVVVLALIGMLNAVPHWYSPRGRRSPAEVAAVLVDFVLGGLRPEGSGPLPR